MLYVRLTELHAAHQNLPPAIRTLRLKETIRNIHYKRTLTLIYRILVKKLEKKRKKIMARMGVEPVTRALQSNTVPLSHGVS